MVFWFSNFFFHVSGSASLHGIKTVSGSLGIPLCFHQIYYHGVAVKNYSFAASAFYLKQNHFVKYPRLILGMGKNSVMDLCQVIAYGDGIVNKGFARGQAFFNTLTR